MNLIIFRDLYKFTKKSQKIPKHFFRRISLSQRYNAKNVNFFLNGRFSAKIEILPTVSLRVTFMYWKYLKLIIFHLNGQKWAKIIISDPIIANFTRKMLDGFGHYCKDEKRWAWPSARIRSLNWKYILKSPSSRIKKKARHRKLPKKRYKRTHPRNGPLGFQENLPSDKCESD